MKKTRTKFILAFQLLSLLWPAAAFAQTNPLGAGLNMRGFSQMFGNGWLSGANTLPDLIGGVTYIMLFLAFSISVLFVIIGGYWYVTSAGNEEQAEKGKNTLINAIIGIVVILLSFTIIRVIINTISGPTLY